MSERAGSGAIVAIGGAEFAMRPANEALHDYVLAQARSDAPRICLIPTASGEPREQIGAFHAAMDRRHCRPSSLSLFRLGEEPVDLAEHLLAQDVIYVTGGNMVNLMALWREHGVGELLETANRAGTVLCGYSAGSMCWFEVGVSRGGGEPAATAGLGLLRGSHCVHYSDDPERRDAYRALVAAGTVPGGIGLDDHAAALFVDGALVEAVRSREGAGAYRVVAEEGEAVELPLRTRLISSGVNTETAIEEMRELRRLRGRFGL